MTEDTVRSAMGEPLRLMDCTVGTIESLQAELSHRLSDLGTVAIDRSPVQRASTVLLQLVAAFVRDVKAQSRAVEWVGANGAFDRGARSLGLVAALGLPGGED